MTPVAFQAVPSLTGACGPTCKFSTDLAFHFIENFVSLRWFGFRWHRQSRLQEAPRKETCDGDRDSFTSRLFE
ncbi:MAG: hypothetical protein CMJ81_08270 [Planctomycetaceae bacterium]|nr:hypothetical protein [Planctomycetaceae bacterium]